MDVRVNAESKAFVISTGNSVSCLGFEVVFEQAKELAVRLSAAGEKLVALGLSTLDLTVEEDKVGTRMQYDQYRSLLQAYRGIDDTKTWFDARTPAKVRTALERARKSGNEVRVFYGDANTGRDWMEEFDVTGRIGRSMGPMRCPLLLSPSEPGGPAVLTHCIVRLVDCDTGVELYRHPTYSQPELSIEPASEDVKVRGYTHSVLKDQGEWKEVVGNFQSMAKAARWVAFMAGEIHTTEQ